MVCFYTNCKVKGNCDQQFLCCWVCDAQAHLSCAGFNGRHLDMISDRSKGLRWSCVNCRALDIDFYRMFKDAKLVISRMKSDFVTVMENLNKMESLFNKFEYVDGSPKRKKTALDIDTGNSNSLPNPAYLISLLSPGVGDNVLQVSTPSTCNPAPNLAAVSSQLEIPATADYIPTDSDESSQTPVVNQASVVNYASAVPSTSTVEISQDSGQKSIHSLVVVPPRKTVFLSRLASDTTVNDIGDFIRSNYSEIGDDIAIFKFNNSQPRDISSFKISVPGKFFNDIVNKSFWPEGVLVREFVHRDRNRSDGYTRLPPSFNVSKN